MRGKGESLCRVQGAGVRVCGKQVTVGCHRKRHKNEGGVSCCVRLDLSIALLFPLPALRSSGL